MELKLEHAAFTQDDFTLSDISLTLHGGISLLTGKSGAGKTTLLLMLSSLVVLKDGTLSLDGRILTSHDSHIGIIFQYPERQLFASTVLIDTSYALRARGIGRREAEERAKAALKEVAIDECKWNESPFALSGGERRRVAIAGTLISDPDVLLMDEPTVGIDGYGYERFLNILEKLKRRGKTVLIATHDENLEEYAERVIVMDGGRIVRDSKSRSWLSFLASRLSTSCDIEAVAEAAAEKVRGLR